MLERGDLRGRGRRLHLPAQADDLAAALRDIDLLAPPQRLLFGKRLPGAGQGELSLCTSRLGGHNAARRFRQFVAELLQFEVLRLKKDELFEVGVHLWWLALSGEERLARRAGKLHTESACPSIAAMSIAAIWIAFGRCLPSNKS